MSVRAANYAQGYGQQLAIEQDPYLANQKARFVLRVKHILFVALMGGVAAAWYYYPHREVVPTLGSSVQATCQCSSVGTIAPHNDYVCTDSSKNSQCGSGLVCANSANAWSYPTGGDFSFICQPFDCDAGLAHWRTGWAYAKIEWCCAHRQKGCDNETPDALVGDDDSSRLRGNSVTAVKGGSDKGDEKNCRVGLQDWQKSWSDEKKSYCCRTSLVGCETIDDQYAAARASAQSR
eukprot:TRINITY_DN11393_c0_g1_i1.p1 TRINITY_DN11393_c0_g1~~TRINITY_DN11393_c0_g1_i1.p1  ORF type:complete len:235 (+),score=38.68 TRINITY_DN11393_c0_g1_i1:134-838(+)